MTKPCVECKSTNHRLSDGREAYPRRKDLHQKPFWFCECGAFVGCHPGTNRALGAPAGKKTKSLRSQAHAEFDELWKNPDIGMTRRQAYKWLAEALLRPGEPVHIGEMDQLEAQATVLLVQQKKKDLSVA